jgi:hypothetical protein
MIYCWVRDCYVAQNEVCVLCKDYDEITDTCKSEEKE